MAVKENFLFQSFFQQERKKENTIEVVKNQNIREKKEITTQTIPFNDISLSLPRSFGLSKEDDMMTKHVIRAFQKKKKQTKTETVRLKGTTTCVTLSV